MKPHNQRETRSSRLSVPLSFFLQASKMDTRSFRSGFSRLYEGGHGSSLGGRGDCKEVSGSVQVTADFVPPLVIWTLWILWVERDSWRINSSLFLVHHKRISHSRIFYHGAGESSDCTSFHSGIGGGKKNDLISSSFNNHNHLWRCSTYDVVTSPCKEASGWTSFCTCGGESWQKSRKELLACLSLDYWRPG